jgi:hypothetical protein
MNNPAAPSSSDAVRRVTFLGLGVMGYPMAGHLAKAGLEVTVYNRTAQKAEQWIAEYGGRAARTPREAVDGAGLVLACVGNDDDLRSITLGDEGAFAGMARGTPSSITPPPQLTSPGNSRTSRASRVCTSSTRRSPAASPARKTAS